MIRKTIFGSIFILLIIKACTITPSFTPLEKLNVVKTSRDSTYLMDKKPFTGQVKRISDLGVTLESFFVSQGKLDGEYQNFYSNGALKLSCAYVNGFLQGSWISFYENNQKSEIINYENGYMQGNRKSFWSNGLVKEENEFNRGVLTGVSNFYYSNGQLRKTIAFDFNGNRDGDWLDYHPNGKIKQKVSYKSGKIIDSLIRYNVEGEIVKTR